MTCTLFHWIFFLVYWYFRVIETCHVTTDWIFGDDLMREQQVYE